jgi:hypothetical protein
MSDARNSDGLCENNNVVEPPELDHELPKFKDIGKKRVDLSTLKDELPIDILLVTVKEHEFLSCYYYIKDTVKRCWCPDLGMVDFGTFGNGGVGTMFPLYSVVIQKLNLFVCLDERCSLERKPDGTNEVCLLEASDTFHKAGWLILIRFLFSC